jgi:hypothetical protein
MQTNTSNNDFNEKEWPSDRAKVNPINAKGKANMV